METVKNILTRPFFQTNHSILVIQIMLIALVGFISMDIYFPSLPALSEFLQVSHGASQFSLTLFLFGFGCSQLFYGPLADYFGRRPVLLVGFSIYLIGSVLLLSMHTIEMLLVARFIQGVGAGAGASLCRVLLRDNFTGNKMAQVASYLTIGIALATALAPALGGIIQERVGFYGNFVVMFSFGAVVTTIVLFFLPETNKVLALSSLHPVKVLKSYGNLLLNKTFVIHLLCSGLALSGLLAYAIVNPFLLQVHLNMSAENYGLITLVIASGELVGTYLNGLLVTRLGYRAMIFLGLVLFLLAALIVLLMTQLGIVNMYSVAVPSFFVTLSAGIIIPNATAGAFSSLDHSIGTAGAIYGFSQIAVTVITTYFITKIPQQTQWSLGYIFLVLALTGLVIYSLSFSLRRRLD